MLWTPKSIELLKQMYKRKKMQEIANFFGCTKNSVIGAVWRHIKKRQKSGRTKTPKPIVVYAPTKPISEFRPSNPVSYPDKRFLADGYCKSIIGEPRFLTSCGNKAELGSSWCKDHQKIYFRKI